MTSIEHMELKVNSHEPENPISDVENEQYIHKTTIEKCALTDPDLLELQSNHTFELRQGGINTAFFSRLKPSEGWAYKVYKAEEDRLVGAVYAIRRGMAWDETQVAYFIANAEQGKGYASDAVGQVTAELQSDYDVIANIEQSNVASERVVKKLGYVSLGVENGASNFIASKDRTSRRRIA